MQADFFQLEYAAKMITRRNRFLAEIDQVTSWSELIAVIEPFYPQGDGRGHPPICLSRNAQNVCVSAMLGLF